LLTLGLAASGVLTAAAPASADYYLRTRDGQLVYVRTVPRRSASSSDVRVSRRRLGTVRHRRVSASGLGGVSFLVGGPIGWGIYRGVDILRRR
jgi:hypothetical protein